MKQQQNLKKILEEGYTYKHLFTTEISLLVYGKEDERILYDSENDVVYRREDKPMKLNWSEDETYKKM